MARVPTSGGNQLGLASQSQKRLAAPDFSAGARAAAQGLGDFGAATMRFAEDQDALQAQLDQAAAKQLDTDYADYSRGVLHTSDGAFYTQEGFNASNARETVEKQLEEKRQELLGRVSNERQRMMLSDALDRRVGADLQGIATYSNRQLRVEETRQSARRAAAAADDAVTYYDNPERFAEEIAVLTGEVRTELIAQGAAPETIQDEVQRAQSTVYRRVAEGMLSRLEVDQAISFVMANRGSMTEPDAVALDRAIAIPLRERKIDGLADYIMGEGRPPAPDAPEGSVQREFDDAFAPDAGAQGFALPLPVEGSITSGFGRRAAPRAGASTNHQAIDIAAPIGSPIRAQAAGRVVSAKDEGNAGLVVRVDYGNGVVASYAHMEGFDVKEGDTVRPGQRLGGVGVTGNTTGPHVHYTLRVNGERVDPTKWTGAVGRPSGGSRQPVRDSGVSREQAMARIEELNLPLEEERALKQEVSNRFADDRAIEVEREETARDAALTILDQGLARGQPVTRESAIPGYVWDAMSPSDRIAFRKDIENNAAGGSRPTDMETYIRLSDMYATDPEGFARLNPAEYLDKLSRRDFQQIFGGWRRSVISEPAGPTASQISEAQVSHSRIRTIMSPALEAAGLTLTGIPTKNEDARRAMAQRIYGAQKAVQDEIALFQRANPGQRVPDDFVREVVERQLTPTRARSDEPSDGFFGNEPTYVPWFERRRLGTTEYSVQIPVSARDRLMRIGREVLNRDPTPQEITRAYLEELRQ